MDGPVHQIAIDKTGTKIAIAYGREVVVLEQNTLCMSAVSLPDIVGQRLTVYDSFLDPSPEIA